VSLLPEGGGFRPCFTHSLQFRTPFFQALQPGGWPGAIGFLTTPQGTQDIVRGLHPILLTGYMTSAKRLAVLEEDARSLSIVTHGLSVSRPQKTWRGQGR
jgi:hypothetical protein